MGANLWPVDVVSGAPTYNGRALRSAAVGPLTGMGSTLTPLGARSGIRPGTPLSVVTVTTTTWSVSPFAGLIAAEASAVSGVYGYSFDTTQTGSIAAAGSAARVDRLDVQVSDPAEGDGSTTPSIQVVYTEGAATGGATPAAPARSHRLCLISVPASGAGSPSVTWAPDWSTAAGAPWIFNTHAELTAVTNVPVGQYANVLADPVAAYNTMWSWSGVAWTLPDMTAALTNVGTNWVAGTGQLIPTATMIGGRVFLDGAVSANGAVSASSIIGVPATFNPPSAGARFLGAAVTSQGGAYNLQMLNGIISIPAGYGVGASITSGCVLPLSGLSYQYN